jgi:hypothetical protein
VTRAAQVLSASERYLLTADRDEKIRVSRFPFTAQIEAFCLAHTEYEHTPPLALSLAVRWSHRSLCARQVRDTRAAASGQ